MRQSNKKMVAQLLYLTNQKEKSIKKLNEILNMAETQKEKGEIDELMRSYKN